MNKSILTMILIVFSIIPGVGIFNPVEAAAHLVTTGMGPVYDGIGHLFLTPEDIIPAIAVGLYAGLRGKSPGRITLFVFPLAWFLGGVVGGMMTTSPSFPLPMISFLILGLMIAADLRIPDTGIIAFVIIIGVTHGFYNGVALREGPGLSGIIGISVTLLVLSAIVSSIVISLKPVWARIAVRVAGSWIAAIGLLMLGWMVKGTS